MHPRPYYGVKGSPAFVTAVVRSAGRCRHGFRRIGPRKRATTRCRVEGASVTLEVAGCIVTIRQALKKLDGIREIQ
jgi:hypothetical protein